MSQAISENKQATAQSIPTCTHCGELCEAEHIQRDGLDFCCQGCNMVHQMLSSHNLDAYYKLEENAGISLKGQSVGGKYAFLEDEGIRSKLLDFTDGTVSKVRFHLPQIHCTSCLWLLERLPWLHDGIGSAKVNYLRKEVSIDFSEERVSLRALTELLASLGYAPNITLEDGEKKSTSNKAFYYQLGVTGFCAGNIMLMSFPEYLGIGSTDSSFRELFGYFNFGLSIPVFFYGGRSYLLAAYQAIKHKGVSIDVPIALGMLALWLQSSYEVFSKTGSGYFDSLAALVFLLLVGRWFQQRTFDHISFERDYKSYFPIAVTKVVDGEEQAVPLEKLDKGDVVRVRNGELIPADAILRSGEAAIDYSFITGEADPIAKPIGELIYAGGRQKGGILELELAKPVSQSYLTQLWNAEAFKKEGKTLQTITDRLGQRFTFAILTIAFAAGLFWWPSSPEMAINVFSAVLIIACPCALALNVPFALGNAMRILSRYGFYLKDTAVIERIANISHWVFDKTGTIAVAGQVAFDGTQPLTNEQEAMVKTLSNHSTHPLSQQVAQSLHPSNNVCYQVSDFEEVAGEGIRGWVGEHLVALGKARFVGLALEEQLAFETRVYISINGKVLGSFRLTQQLRDGVGEVLGNMVQASGVSLLSGDHDGERTKLEGVLGSQATMRFRQSPEEKLTYIAQLQQQGEQVAMVGDGLNDAGALKQSDVGIAVSEQVQQFAPACDAILQASNIQDLERFQKFAKLSLRVVYIGFILSLGYNLVGLSYAVRGMLEPVVAAILMPLSSITVVGFGTLATTWLGRKVLHPPAKPRT